LKFQAVAEKTAKDARGLLYFAAPGIQFISMSIIPVIPNNIEKLHRTINQVKQNFVHIQQVSFNMASFKTFYS